MRRVFPAWVLTFCSFALFAQNRSMELRNWSAPQYWHTSVRPEIESTNPQAQAGSISVPAPLVAITPCRLVDTRLLNGPFGGPIMGTGETRTFVIPASPCGVPSGAAAYSLNVTVAPQGPLGFLTAWPAGASQPGVSTLNDQMGVVLANAAIVPAGVDGAISVYVTNTTHLVIDINGYYMPSLAQAPAGNANFAFNLATGTPSSPVAPHPFESDPGWGGGAQPTQLVDGYRGCNDPSGWACGLAFTGGDANWGGQACGVRQATINLGATPVQVSAVRITHHGLEHVPKIYQIQTWNGSTWVTQVSMTTNSAGRCIAPPTYDPAVGWTCTLTDEFSPVQTTKVRYTFNNCPNANTNVSGGSITHGWLWEFEAYRLPW